VRRQLVLTRFSIKARCFWDAVKGAGWVALGAALSAESVGWIALGGVLSAWPRGRRFAAAQRAARVIRPLLRFRFPSAMQDRYLDGHREWALRCAFASLHQRGGEFAPALTVSGADAIGADGAVFVTGHFRLTGLFIRWLFDRGHRISVVMFRPPARPRVAGTRVPLDVIRPDAMVFMRIRQRVRNGGVVIIALDQRHPQPGCRRIETPAGERYISDALMRFAERSRIPVLFFSTRVAPTGDVVARVIRPTSSQAAAVFDEFYRFLCFEVDEVEFAPTRKRSVSSTNQTIDRTDIQME
jgi:hypothetical protein